MTGFVVRVRDSSQERARRTIPVLLGEESPRVASARFATVAYGALHHISESFRLANSSMWLGEKFTLEHATPVNPEAFVSQFLAMDDDCRDRLAGHPGIVIARLDCVDGHTRHVVSIPGTGSILGPTGFNSDLAVMATAHTQALDTDQMPELTRRVIDAMNHADIAPDDEVLLVGHSLGGMVAADIASRPSLRARHNIRGVVAVGSPLGGFRVSADVAVLSISHEEDPIPMLRSGADDPTWARYRVPAVGSMLVFGAHRMSAYRRTVADLETAPTPAVRTWLARHMGFGAATMRVSAFALMDGRKHSPAHVPEPVVVTPDLVSA